MPDAIRQSGQERLSGCGADVSGASRFDRYDPATNSWTVLTAPARSHVYPAGIGVIGGKLYQVGGKTTNSTSIVPVQTLESFDPGTGMWKTLAPMPTARYGGAAVTVNGLLYVMGGFDASGVGLSTAEVYSPATDSWRTLSSMPTGSGYPAAGVLGGMVYVVGGECCGSGTELMRTQAYTP